MTRPATPQFPLAQTLAMLGTTMARQRAVAGAAVKAMAGMAPDPRTLSRALANIMSASRAGHAPSDAEAGGGHA